MYDSHTNPDQYKPITQSLVNTTIIDWLAPHKLADYLVTWQIRTEEEHNMCKTSDRTSGGLVSCEEGFLYWCLRKILDRQLFSLKKNLNVYIRYPGWVGLNRDEPKLLKDSRLNKVYAPNIMCNPKKPRNMPVAKKLQQWPLGVFNGTLWRDTLLKGEGLEAQVAHRKVLLECGGMSLDTDKERASKQSTLVKNGFSCDGKVSAPEYMTRLLHAKFVFAPKGKGMQTYREWEALLAGAVPLMDEREACMKEAYIGLPVIFVKDWWKVTPQFLEGKWDEILRGVKTGAYDMRKNYFPYWLHQIGSNRQ